MASSLTALLVSQKYGDNFDFPKEKLGNDILNVPDYNPYSPTAFADADYPIFTPQELPADVVKGTLQFTKRPFIAVRYALAEKENNGQYVAKATDKLVTETFFQRHNTNTAIATIHKRELSEEGALQLTTETITPSDSSSSVVALKKWWNTASNSNREIHGSGSLSDEHWQMLKNILEAKPLDQTEGRYLPCYRNIYMSQNAVKV